MAPKTPLRRSTRVATASAKKAASEALISPTKPGPTTDRATPARAKSKKKTATKGPIRSAIRKAVGREKRTASPKKASKTKAKTKSKTITRVRSTVVSTPADDEEWTDSPPKKSPGRGRSKSLDGDGIHSRPGRDLITSRRASVGGIRQTTEPRGTSPPRRSRSQSETRRSPEVSRAKSRSRSKSPAKMVPRSPSKSPSRRRRSSLAAESSAPVPKSPPPVITQSRSRSPHKGHSHKAGRQSPPMHLGTTPNLGPGSAASPQRSPEGRQRSLLEAFRAKDAHGGTLRECEAIGYISEHVNKGIGPVVANGVEDEDKKWAVLRGTQRAEKEMALNQHLGAETLQLDRNRADDRMVSPSRRNGRSASPRRSSPAKDMAGPDITSLRRASASTGNTGAVRRSASPSKSNLPRAPASERAASPTTKRKFSRTESPGPNERSETDKAHQEPRHETANQRPSEPGRGPVHSVTNPEYIVGTSMKNPFFETMPGPEIWHKNMPAQFPFGDTPRLEAAISQQIDDDRAKAREQEKMKEMKSASLFSRATSTIKSTLAAVGQTVWGASPSSRKPAIEYPPMWTLPSVSEAEVVESMVELQVWRAEGRNGDDGAAPVGRERIIRAAARSVKRARLSINGS